MATINKKWIYIKWKELQSKEKSIPGIYDLKLQEELLHACGSAACCLMSILGYLDTPFTSKLSLAALTYSVGNFGCSLFGKLGAINRELKTEKDELDTTLSKIRHEYKIMFPIEPQMLQSVQFGIGVVAENKEIRTTTLDVTITLILTRFGGRRMSGLGRLLLPIVKHGKKSCGKLATRFKTFGRAKTTTEEVSNIAPEIRNVKHVEQITKAVRTTSTFREVEFDKIEPNIIDGSTAVAKISLNSIFGVSISVLSFVYCCYKVYRLKAEIDSVKKDPKTVELCHQAFLKLRNMQAFIHHQIHANDDSDDVVDDSDDDEYDIDNIDDAIDDVVDDNNDVVDDNDDDEDDIDNFNNR